MLKKYYLMSDTNTTPIGVLTINNDSFSFERNNTYNGPLPFFITYSGGELSDSELIKLWISERVPEPHYMFIDALTERAGLTEYDPVGFFEYNKGVFNTDDFHIVPV